MEFLTDFGLFALVIIVIMAFMGLASTKIAETFGGKKKDEAFNHNKSTKQGWKNVGGKKNS
jgi:hypothetical protein